MRNALIAVGSITIVLSGAASAGVPCGEPTGDWAWGPSLGAACNGEIAVFGSGRVLNVANISDPSHPMPVSHMILGDLVRGAAIGGRHAFAAASKAGLTVVDISDPERPELTTTWITDDMVIDVTLDGDKAYVANRSSGMAILDVSNPTDPIQVGAIDPGGMVWDVAIHDDLAFLANAHDGMQIVDVSDASNPVVISTLVEAGKCRGIDVSANGRWVYVADFYDGMRVIDASDPASPTLVAFVDVYNYATDVKTRGSYVYLGNRGNGLRIFDVSDPTNPVEVRQVDHAGETYSVMLDGNLAYLANFAAGLRVVDISVPDQAEELGFIDGRPSLFSPAIDGGLAVLPGGKQLVTLDVSDPSNPVEITKIDVPGYAYAAVISGDLAYIADGARGLAVLDLSDPRNPLFAASAETPDAHDVAFADNTVFLSCYSDGVRILDVSDPAEPLLVGSVEGINNRYLAHADGMLYVPEHDVGVHLIDVGDPTSPSLIALLDLPEAYHRPVIHNDLLFVPTSGHGVQILDIENPAAPVEIGEITQGRYVYGIAAAGHLVFLADIYNGSFVFDISDPTTPIELAANPLATTAEGGSAAQGPLVLVAEDRGGVEIFDLNSCFSESPTADFTWRPKPPHAGHLVQLTDTSIGSVSNWLWRFDDDATSSERYPTRMWTVAGNHEVTLTVSGDFGSQSITRTITVLPRTGDRPPITEPGDFVYVIAAAAHASGLEGTQWVTDAVLHNPGLVAAETVLWFMEAGQNNLEALGVGISVQPGSSQLIEDIVLSVFHESEAAGAILVGADQPLIVTSRTSNDAPSGTYGQSIPGRAIGSGVTQNQAVHLIQLTRSSTFRTNLGVANPTPDLLQVEISLRGKDGAEIASRTMAIPPFGFNQRTDIFGTDLSDGYAVVSSTTPGASYFPYASVVDNRTGDPVLVEPLQAADELLVAAAAHVGGLEDTDWRTDLEVCNLGIAAADLRLDLLESGVDNSSARSQSSVVPPSSCNRLEDVLDSVFDYQGTAALEIQSASGAVLVSSRTFNTTDVGTFGQFLPAVGPDAAIVFGEEARIVHLAQGTADNTGFRTNIGFVNRAETPTTVKTTLFDSGGSHLGDLTTTLKPFEHRQVNRIFRQVTSNPVTSGYAIVTTSSGNGSFVAYASVVDNASGDPIFIPATRVAAEPIAFELLTTGLGSSSGNYPSDGDLELACTSWGGQTATVADWNDVVAIFAAEGEAFADSTSILSGRSYFIDYDGESNRPGTEEHYLIARHDGALPPDFNTLDDVGDHFIDLGAAEGVTLQVVCRRPLQ